MVVNNNSGKSDSSKNVSGSARIYTRGGDTGKTSLLGGSRVPKSHHRLEIYGTLDEFNSALGLMAAHLPSVAECIELQKNVETLQSRLFDLGSRLACETPEILGKLGNITEADIIALEMQMDGMSSQLRPLKNFILPGGSPASATAHLARTICRRAERALSAALENSIIEHEEMGLKLLNRASDWCFVVARYLHFLEKRREVLWTPRNP